MRRIPKELHLIEKVRKCIRNDDYLVTNHAQMRLDERFITRSEMRFALINGYHEKAKDTYDSVYKRWRYSIVGNTQDEIKLRVIVSIDQLKKLLIITVINLAG